MPMDKNPRHFFLDVANMDVNVDADQTTDFVTIEFGGMITPTLKERITKALDTGEYEIKSKKFG